MSTFLTKSQLSFQKRVRKIVRRILAPVAEQVEQERFFPRELLPEMGRKGLLGAPFSKNDGGQGLGWSHEVIVAEEVSAVSAATEMARLASAALYSAPLSAFGTRLQKRDFLAPVLSGAKVGALALTEPGAGSDVAGMKTSACLEGGSFVVNGEKRFITNGSSADFLFVFAVTSPEMTKRGISAFVIPRETKGVSIVKKYGLMGMHGADVAHIQFKDVRVSDTNLVGKVDNGFSILLDELDKERPVVSAGMIGIARAAFEAAVRYSASRRQFGRPIREFEGVSFRIADMAARLEASRLLVHQAAQMIDSGTRATKEGAIAKLFATEAAFDIAHQALQIHGGIGYTKDLSIERYFRDARFMMIGGGTSEIMRFVIQREVYKESELKSPS